MLVVAGAAGDHGGDSCGSSGSRSSSIVGKVDAAVVVENSLAHGVAGTGIKFKLWTRTLVIRRIQLCRR